MHTPGDWHILTRRDFLKISSLAGSVLISFPITGFLPPDDRDSPVIIGKGRVATHAIYRYQEPSFSSQRLGMLKRDEVVDIFQEITAPQGPAYNPRWYQLEMGYIHSGYIQRVDKAQYNYPPLEILPESGLLAEVTVPITRSYRRLNVDQWTPLYRLYYQSVHWITDVDVGPDGSAWYRLTDDLLHVRTYVPASHLRPIDASELSPISPDVPEAEKRIEVSIENQILTAFEGDQAVLKTKVSTGIPTKGPSPNGIPTDTPMGRFRVQTKMPSRHMGEGELNSDLEAYELPGVPWVCFFHKEGIALHGTYWHDNFGRMMSHGCVNLRMEDAKWIYRWTRPLITPDQWYAREQGTLVLIS
jgi:lipoprotein-anchoring transpeptidase ErfK/SrfK